MARYGSPGQSSANENLKVALGVGAVGLILFFMCLVPSIKAAAAVVAVVDLGL